MKISKLLVAAVLGIAIAAPIAGFIGERNVAQPMTSTDVLLPFLHGFPTGRAASRAELASLERATRNAGAVAENIGDVDKAMAGAVTRVEATYQVPGHVGVTIQPA